jgi:hypothetical protein
MPDAPRPITSPPAQSFQPWDANAPGTEDDTATPDVYGANSPDWPKVQDGGAADWSSGKITGGWPGNGASDGGAWEQT